MGIYFINSDAKTNGGVSYHDAWLDRGIAITSGPAKYRTALERVSRGDTVLMYVNGVGVVAVGTVLDDQVTDVVAESSRVSPVEPIEYHRRTDWTLDLRHCPITAAALREARVGGPRHAVQRIVKGEKQAKALLVSLSETPAAS